MTKHLLTLNDLLPSEIEEIIYDAKERKKKGLYTNELEGKFISLIFEKSSTRTRVSFEVAMSQLGGKASFFPIQELQLGRGEPLSDTAKVISSMVDCMVLRTARHETLVQFSENSQVPVINGLTDASHPCQLLADLLTFFENQGSIKNKKVTWIGDYNNMCKTYIEASSLLNFDLHIACPKQLQPNLKLLDLQRVTFTESLNDAIKDSHLVTTDVWISMGDKEKVIDKKSILKQYQVTPEILDKANKEAIFLHCLPAIRGQEISKDMLNDSRSRVWQQAENRLHAQKSLLIFLLKN
jgi:ornithine carbamoyltransferase